MSRCFLSPLVVFLFVLALSSQSSPAIAAGKSGKGQETVAKLSRINKQALGQLQRASTRPRAMPCGAPSRFSTTRTWLTMRSARERMLHLAAVYMTGFNDRTKAIRQFVMAFKINPNIKITPQVETAALDEAYDAARSQANLAPAARTTAAAGRLGASLRQGLGRRLRRLQSMSTRLRRRRLVVLRLRQPLAAVVDRAGPGDSWT